MSATPTRFDPKHYKTLPTEAARHEYLLDVSQGIRDNAAAELKVTDEEGYVAPIGFTVEEWKATLTDQIRTMSDNLKKYGR